MDEVADDVLQRFLFVGVGGCGGGVGRGGLGCYRRRDARVARLHPGRRARQEEAVPKRRIEEVGLVELRPVRVRILNRFARIDERGGEAVADA